MKTYQITHTDMEVSRIAYGCMPLGGGWERTPLSDQTRKQALVILRTALDEGINFFDHADIYSLGKSEEAFSALWQEVPGIRTKIYVQSKCGIRFEGDTGPTAPHRFDFSYEHIIEAVEGSLKRLKTDYLDVLLLHRPDPLVEPEEVARAFDVLHAKGKVRYFGVSNHTAAGIELLAKYVRQPLIFNQLALNVIHTHLLDESIVLNQDQPARLVRGEGTLEYCRLHDITIQAWGALAWGRVSGRQIENQTEAEKKTAALVESMARQKMVSRESILVAWLLRHPAHIQPIIGTTNLERIQNSCQADTFELSREEWNSLFIAGRGEELP